MSTMRLKLLVAEVLSSHPARDAEDVVEEVFVAIEGNPAWCKTYDTASSNIGKDKAATWAGFWVSHLTQRVGDQRQTSARSKIIESFTRLGTPGPKRSKKLKEPQAVQAMHEHFLAHRETLPRTVREHREVIVSLIMDGLPVETAFQKAIETPAFAWR